MSTAHYGWWIRVGAAAVILGLGAVVLGVAMGMEQES